MVIGKRESSISFPGKTKSWWPCGGTCRPGVLPGPASLTSRGLRSERLSESGREVGAPPGSQDPAFIPRRTAAHRLLPRQAVAQILPFRDQNRKALDSLWNRHHVERVEIVLKETVDAEGA